MGNTDRINYLDGLRGIAAFAVFICHALYNFLPDVLNCKGIFWIFASPLGFFFFKGSFAVTVFFILSGYVLTQRFFQTGDYKILEGMAVRRYPRLMIPVLGSVIFVYLLLNLHMLIPTESTPAWENIPPVYVILFNGLYGVFFNGDNSFNPPLWTMKTEFLGSIIVFMMAALFGKSKHRFLFYIGTLIFFKISHFTVIILGMIIADLYNSSDLKIYKLQNEFFLLLVFLLGSYFGCYHKDSIFYSWIGKDMSSTEVLFLMTVGASLILISILSSNILKAFFSSKIFTFLGKISFSLYLTHVIIIHSFSTNFYNWYNALSDNSTLSGCLTILFTIPVVIAIAYVFMITVDNTGVTISKKIYNFKAVDFKYYYNSPVKYLKMQINHIIYFLSR